MTLLAAHRPSPGSGSKTERVPAEPLIADCERLQGTGHPDTLTSRNNLAMAYQNGEIAGLTAAPAGAVLSLSVTRPLEFSQCGLCLNWLPGSYPTPACGQQARMLDLDACGGSWGRFGKLNVRHGKGSGRRGTQAAADAADQGR